MREFVSNEVKESKKKKKKKIHAATSVHVEYVVVTYVVRVSVKK